MICHAQIGTSLRGGGRTALTTLRSDPPLTLMPTPDGVYVVGSAAGPLNGDRLALTINVAAGTELTVHTVAASLAWPGTSPVPSQLRIEATIGEGATLRWLPEPLVPVAGSSHRVTAHVDLAADSLAIWREEIVLGRHNEEPGNLSSRLDVVLEDAAAVRQELSVGPDAHGAVGPAVTGGRRAIGMTTVAGDRAPAGAPAWSVAGNDFDAALLTLQRGGMQVSAAARSAPALRRALDAGLDHIFTMHAPNVGADERSSHVGINF
ncbi:MAG: urease accessory protein UreD [Solirubrobacterales bacterium]